LSEVTSIKGFITAEGEAKYDFEALENVPEVLKSIPSAKVGQVLYAESVDENGKVTKVSAKDAGDTSKPVITWIKGAFVHISTGKTQNSDVYSVTDFIDVSGINAMKIRVESQGNACVALYRSDEVAILSLCYVPANEGLSKVLHTIDVSTAAYIRVSCVTTYLPNAIVEPVTMSETTEKIMGNWYDTLGERMTSLLDRAKSKKICCIIDDDTKNYSAVMRFKQACEEHGIKGTYACLTDYLAESVSLEDGSSSTLKDELLKIEAQGFNVVIHAKSQNKPWEDYKNSINLTENKVLCEMSLVQGMQVLSKAGFTDYKYWVTPYCLEDEVIQGMARRHGIKCAFAGGNAFEPADGSINGRYAIRRIAFNYDGYPDGSTTYDEVIAVAEAAAQNNGWLNLMTHFSEWTYDEVQQTEFSNMINRLRELDFEFMTVSEAWNYRKAIYDVYDMF